MLNKTGFTDWLHATAGLIFFFYSATLLYSVQCTIVSLVNYYVFIVHLKTLTVILRLQISLLQY